VIISSGLEGNDRRLKNRRINPAGPLHITVLHNDALEEAQALAELVQREYSPIELFISIVSPALGVHTGPRAIALCGYAG
jgi:fatty acid-binding protein DegV